MPARPTHPRRQPLAWLRQEQQTRRLHLTGTRGHAHEGNSKPFPPLPSATHTHHYYCCPASVPTRCGGGRGLKKVAHIGSCTSRQQSLALQRKATMDTPYPPRFS